MTRPVNAPIRIVLVDDSVVVRGLLSRVINAQPDMEVAGSASDGKSGLARIADVKPDVVLLDIEMPIMDGITALTELRRIDRRLPIIMFSSLTERGAAITMKALSLGASDYAAKPTGGRNVSDGFDQVAEELLVKIRSLVGSRRSAMGGRSAASSRSSASGPSNPPSARPRAGLSVLERVDAVVIGCSTGGPGALEQIMLTWQKPLPVPAFIVQHMPPVFTKALADRLDRKTASRVVEAEEGMAAEPGVVYIAPGGRHMLLTGPIDGDVIIALNDGPPLNSCRPSVDPLFRSAMSVYGSNTLAVMLTGMGNDGLNGAGDLARVGATIVAQDEETSVVWGMPGAVVDAGLAAEVLPLAEIGPRIAQVRPRSVRRPVMGGR